MKLVRFQDASGDRIGVLRDDGIAPITGMSSLQMCPKKPAKAL